MISENGGYPHHFSVTPGQRKGPVISVNKSRVNTDVSVVVDSSSSKDNQRLGASKCDSSMPKKDHPGNLSLLSNFHDWEKD